MRSVPSLSAFASLALSTGKALIYQVVFLSTPFIPPKPLCIYRRAMSFHMEHVFHELTDVRVQQFMAWVNMYQSTSITSIESFRYALYFIRHEVEYGSFLNLHATDSQHIVGSFANVSVPEVTRFRRIRERVFASEDVPFVDMAITELQKPDVWTEVFTIYLWCWEYASTPEGREEVLACIRDILMQVYDFDAIPHRMSTSLALAPPPSLLPLPDAKPAVRKYNRKPREKPATSTKERKKGSRSPTHVHPAPNRKGRPSRSNSVKVIKSAQKHLLDPPSTIVPKITISPAFPEAEDLGGDSKDDSFSHDSIKKDASLESAKEAPESTTVVGPITKIHTIHLPLQDYGPPIKSDSVQSTAAPPPPPLFVLESDEGEADLPGGYGGSSAPPTVCTRWGLYSFAVNDFQSLYTTCAPNHAMVDVYIQLIRNYQALHFKRDHCSDARRPFKHRPRHVLMDTTFYYKLLRGDSVDTEEQEICTDGSNVLVVPVWAPGNICALILVNPATWDLRTGERRNPSIECTSFVFSDSDPIQEQQKSVVALFVAELLSKTSSKGRSPNVDPVRQWATRFFQRYTTRPWDVIPYESTPDIHSPAVLTLLRIENCVFHARPDLVRSDKRDTYKTYMSYQKLCTNIAYSIWYGQIRPPSLFYA
jgi:hypothetical protein